MHRTSQHIHILLRFFVCSMVITAAIGLFFSNSVIKAASPAVKVWLTTTDGINHLTPQSDLQFTPDSTTGATAINVDDTQQFQQMDGFGAAITDSSAWLIANKMSATQRNTVMQNLFDPAASDPTSIGLSFIRIPMGASDFSVTGAYSYDDLPAGQTDPTLSHFSIAHDTAYILPVIQQAHQINPAAKFAANPWSPPGWMKTNGSMIGTGNGQTGTLIPADYNPLAQYFVKFIQAYQAPPNNIPIYAITPQNEPLFVPSDYPGMSWPASDESNFIKNNLAPALASANLNAKILGYDHDWINFNYAQTLLNDPTTNNDLAGISWHCYNGDPSAMTTVHNQFPNKDMYEMECATGIPITHISTINLLMQSVQNWSRAVVLWNLALDPNHGPHTGGCTLCNGVVTIDQSTGNTTYTNDYYLLGQFSKFVTPGAFHIAASIPTNGNVTDVAFKNTDGSRVVVAANNGGSSSTFKVSWDGTQSFSYTLPAGATVSFVWSGTSTSTPTPGTTPTPPSGVTPTPTPSPTATLVPSPTPGVTPTPTVPTGGVCKVSYMVQNQWTTGFTTNITLTNTSTTALNGWTLGFTFPSTQQVTQGWSGTFVQQGNKVTVTNLSYNGAVSAGGSLSFGFNGTWSGSNPSPTSFTLNGATCSTA